MKGILCLLMAVTISAQADEVLLKNGQTSVGTIKKLDGGRIFFEIKVGGGSAELPYALDQIDRITFTLSDVEKKLINNPSVENLPALDAWWQKRKPYLGVTGSDSGIVGRKLAEAMLAKKTIVAAKQALALLVELEKGDWDKSQSGAVASVRLQALIQSGQSEAAMSEASKMSEVSPGNEGAMVEMRFIRAQGAAAKLTEIDRKHPRWREEKRVAAERRTYYDSALDEALYPVVFFPTQTTACARGLWMAAELYAANGEQPRAIVCLNEIISEFPDPAYAARARELKTKLEGKTNKEKS